MKSQSFLFPLIGLVSGILFSEFLKTEIWIHLLWLIWIVLFLLLLGLKRFRTNFSALSILLFFGLGWFFSVQINRWQPIPENRVNQPVVVHLKVNEIFRSSEKYRKYKAELISVDSIHIQKTAVLFYVKKELPELFVGEEIWSNSKLLNLQKPLNPYQFDYSKYLERKGIHYAIFQNSEFIKVEGKKGFSYYSSAFKRNIYKKLIEAGYEKPTADLIGAMLLGDRTDMDAEIENDYRRTGVVHLLAISGLHVMMVYSIFLIVLYPVIFLKNGKKLRIILSLILIWAFVAFVDFRPPVFRSGLMISIFHLTVLLHRKPNVYHTLILSALILLLYNPNFLFDPGFLLSYSAVFFIVFLNPVYQKLFRPKKKFSRLIISFTGTTVSAQLGTLPFSVYFFNMSSALFLAGNVVMIAASYFMVAGGMFSVFLVAFGIDFKWWTIAFDFFINSCNAYVHWLSSFDHFVFDRLSLTVFEVILFFIGLILIRQLVFKPKPKFLYLFLTLIFVFEFQRMIRSNQLLKKQEFVIFHQNKNTIIGIRKSGFMDVFLADLTDSARINKFIVKPYAIHQKIKTIRFLDLNASAKGFYLKNDNSIEMNGKRLLFSDTGNLDSADFVLILNNSKPDLVSEDAELIIDGSNYPNFAERIEHPKIWNTREKGARIIDLNSVKE